MQFDARPRGRLVRHKSKSGLAREKQRVRDQIKGAAWGTIIFGVILWTIGSYNNIHWLSVTLMWSGKGLTAIGAIGLLYVFAARFGFGYLAGVIGAYTAAHYLNASSLQTILGFSKQGVYWTIVGLATVVSLSRLVDVFSTSSDQYCSVCRKPVLRVGHWWASGEGKAELVCSYCNNEMRKKRSKSIVNNGD